MKTICTLLLISYSILCVSAQNTHQLEGKVIERATKLPIPYASIKITNSKTTAISNAEGEFKIHSLNDQDTLIISSLGFTTIKVAGSDIKSIVFELAESATLLSDVEIKPLDALSILRNAVKTSNASYPSTLILQGYYKEYVKRDSFITKYADGMLNYFIEKKEGKTPKITLQVLESRAKILPVSEEDDKYDALNSAIDVEAQAGFIYPGAASPINSTKNDYYNYKINEVNENGQSMYLIKFEPKVAGLEALFEGRVYIDKESSLIKSITYKVTDISAPFLKKINILGIKVAAKTNSVDLKYTILNNNYCLAYLNREASISIASKSINQISTFKSEFLVTHLQTKDCVPFSEGIYTKRSLFKRGTNYKTEFWKQPNLIINTVEEADFIRREK